MAVPGVLFLAFKYRNSPEDGILANANIGGDNCNRGSLLGAILGCMSKKKVLSSAPLSKLYEVEELEQNIEKFINACVSNSISARSEITLEAFRDSYFQGKTTPKVECKPSG